MRFYRVICTVSRCSSNRGRSSLFVAMPGAVAQGLIWGIMAIGVYITFRILDIADLSVDGTMCTGAAVCIMMMQSGTNVWISMLVATLVGMVVGLATGIFHTVMGIPAILAGILTQLGQYQGFADINMGKGAIVIGLVAVIIGEAVFGKIFKNFATKLLAVALGGVIYYIVLQVVIWLGVDTNLLKLFQALVVAVFLAVPYWKSRYFTKPKKIEETAKEGK